MPAPKAGVAAPAKKAAAPAIAEDPSTMIPCPVITAHPDGFVERTEPDRETHEVRCVRPPRRGISTPTERNNAEYFPGLVPRPGEAPPGLPARPPGHPDATAPPPRSPPPRVLTSPPRFSLAARLARQALSSVGLTFDRASAGKAVNDDEASQDPTALNIYEATERSFSIDVPHDMRDSALEYELKLYNGSTVRALIYLVYAEPLTRPGIASDAKAADASTAKPLRAAPGGGVADAEGHTWLPVTRARCAKGCTGPILSAIQRFGKQGRTQKGAAPAQDAGPAAAAGDKWKDARNLFISIDEASNHVCAYGPNRCKVFR